MRDLDAELDELTIPDLRDRLTGGRLTAEELADAYRDRIRRLDPQLGAVLAEDPTAIAQAQASDRRRATGRDRGPLDGIPVLIKDNIDAIGLPGTAGSRALLSSSPPTDSDVVRRLRHAGAVLLGSANLSEWANFRSERSTSGWSAVCGQTANPHVLDHNPSGSSSGSAAAVASAFAQVTLGTETDGSITSPAGACGIVGLKPTLGRLSGTGIVPISGAQDTVGPLARTVHDVAITLGVLAEFEPETAELPGVRIGVWRLAGADHETDRVVEEAVTTLAAAGAEPVEVVLPYQPELGAAEWQAMISEFQPALERYLRTRPGAPRTLSEIIAFNAADPVELSLFGQDIFERALAAAPLSDPRYRTSRRSAASLGRRCLDETFKAYELDVILTPTNIPAWRTNYAAGDKDVLSSSSPAAVSGYPNISVPAGFAGPLPIGVSLIGQHNADPRLLALAEAIESALAARRPPRFLPSLPD
jgi:amidase